MEWQSVNREHRVILLTCTDYHRPPFLWPSAITTKCLQWIILNLLACGSKRVCSPQKREKNEKLNWTQFPLHLFSVLSWLDRFHFRLITGGSELRSMPAVHCFASPSQDTHTPFTHTNTQPKCIFRTESWCYEVVTLSTTHDSRKWTILLLDALVCIDWKGSLPIVSGLLTYALMLHHQKMSLTLLWGCVALVGDVKGWLYLLYQYDLLEDSQSLSWHSLNWNPTCGTLSWRQRSMSSSNPNECLCATIVVSILHHCC